MVWTPHLIVGSIIAAKTGNPVLGLVLAWLSHYLLDFIPHKEYTIPPVEQAHRWSWATFFKTIGKIGIDFSVGIAAVLFLFREQNDLLVLALAGAILAIVPDGVTFLFYKFRISGRLPKLHQQFHEWCNRWYLPYTKGKEPIFAGVITQILVVLIAPYL